MEGGWGEVDDIHTDGKGERRERWLGIDGSSRNKVEPVPYVDPKDM